MDINGLAAIVTGAGSGLGAATARRLAEGGAKVALFDIADDGRKLAEEIGGLFFAVDVTDEGAVATAVAQAEAAHGKARILVNCAGIVRVARTIAPDGTPHPTEVFRKVVEVNLLGTFVPITQFAARLVDEDGIGEECGVIVNVASAAAYDGQPGLAAYAASKAGVAGMTLSIARDLAPRRIRVVSIAPGYFLTGQSDSAPEDMLRAMAAQVPHPSRLGRPPEFAQLVEAIVANPMINGDVFRIDGAMRLPYN